MDQARDLLATTSSVLVLLGLAVRFILYPWMRDQLVRPMTETHRQVTENSHANTTPTLPDRIEDLATDVRAMTRVLDEHLAWSDRWAHLHELRLELLERQEDHENGDAHD